MARGLFVLIGVCVYLLFLGTFLYLIAFLGDASFVPRTVDHGPVTGVLPALAIDVALIALFGVQHSAMARQPFKQRWTRIVPPPIERSVYVLCASLVLILLFAGWRPITAPVWRVSGVGAVLPWVIFGLGWAIVLLSTFLINHFELFGLRQVWLNLRGGRGEAPRFRQPFFYKLVRHPLYSGFFLAFWATPTMSAGHLVLALGMSAYMLIAIRYEERDLVGLFGDRYERYRRDVGMLTPRFRRGI